MSKWNCPVCDRDFEDSEEMDSGICRKCAKYTADIQSACAAGPWRTDVENAPKDGSEIAAEFDVLGFRERHFVVWHSGSGSWESPSEKLPDDALHAFAVPNPPQVTT